MAVQHVGDIHGVVRRHRHRRILAVPWQPEPDAASVETVTERAGDDNWPGEGPAAIGGAGEPDAVTADPGNIHIPAIDGLLRLGVLAWTAPADLGNRPNVWPRSAGHGLPHGGDTGCRDRGNNRGCQYRAKGDQTLQNALAAPAVNHQPFTRGR